MLKIESKLALITANFQIDDITVTNDPIGFEKLKNCAQSYYNKYKDNAIADIKGVQHARTFFRAIGIDPTKRRPSSEALLNRSIKAKDLYTINTLVDIGNWCSLDFLLPVGIYDSDKILGDISLLSAHAEIKSALIKVLILK